MPMRSLLSTRRRLINRFEVVDIASEADLTACRAALDIPIRMDVRWNSWDYGSEVKAVRALYEKSKRAQWNASDDLDWSAQVSRDEWIGDPDTSTMATLLRAMGKDEKTQKAAMFDEVAYNISQLLHGEQAALQICGQLTNLCPTTDEKLFTASQAADEARHTEAVARFLAEKMGSVYPVNPVNKLILDEILSTPGYHAKALGMQTLFEGVALGMFEMLLGTTTSALLRDLLTRIRNDEARHAAFGVLTMRKLTSGLDAHSLDELEDWAFRILEALNANQQMDMLRTVGAAYSIDPDAAAEMAIGTPAWLRGNPRIYMRFVMPNLMRLGLVTHRTKSTYCRLGMLVDEDALGAAAREA
jgi:1,2-phenylacetyl-CoA epoxidase catalytic subunit